MVNTQENPNSENIAELLQETKKKLARKIEDTLKNITEKWKINRCRCARKKCRKSRIRTSNKQDFTGNKEDGKATSKM